MIVAARSAAVEIGKLKAFPQRLKPSSFQSNYIRAEARTLQRQEFSAACEVRLARVGYDCTRDPLRLVSSRPSGRRSAGWTGCVRTHPRCTGVRRTRGRTDGPGWAGIRCSAALSPPALGAGGAGGIDIRARHPVLGRLIGETVELAETA